MTIALRRFAGTALATVALLLAFTPMPVLAAPNLAAPTGSVSGRITDANVAVAGATVIAQLAVYPVGIAQTVTDADGTFRLDPVPGQYKIRFELPGGLFQYYPGQTDFAAATVLTVVAGADIAIEDSVIPHGAIDGQITTSTGVPAPAASVALTRLDGVPVASVVADGSGHYGFGFVAAGSYNMSVAAAKNSAPRQWVHEHKTRTGADAVAATVGQHTTVDERLLPLGTISGTFTDAGGPVSNVVIRADSQLSPAETVFAATATDGTFRLYAYPGTYTVEYSAPGALDQWYHGQESARLADIVTVTANADVALTERALPSGRVSGRLTNSTGAPESGAAVVIADPGHDRQFLATTDADGAWFATVRPGTYQVRFETSTAVQWAHARTSAASADPIVVTADHTTVVDDRLAVPGSLTVRAVDARTGAPVATFCADAFAEHIYAQACTDDGSAEFAQLGAGTYTVTVSDGAYLDNVTRGVRVTVGAAASLTARMQRGATISLTVADAASGTPVGQVCVNGYPADRPLEVNEFVGGCAEPDGTLTLSRVPLGRYVFFADVFDGTHGSQWVGPHGGVGAQASAKVITTRAGVSVALGVKLDGKGTVTGVVTDRTSGAAISGAEVGIGRKTTTTGSDGRYVLDGLGPYGWVLFAGHDAYAGLWSGGGNNRLAATPVPVRAGQATPYNVALRQGTTLTGRITATGGRLESAEVIVVDADTYDTIAQVTAAPDGTYTAHIFGPRDVKLLTQTVVWSVPQIGWYRDSIDFAHAQTVPMPSNGTRTVNIAIH